MRILIYKRTHVGDPTTYGEFGNEDCMGSVRGFAIDAVIGVGGISKQPLQQRLARKINWVGRNPKKVQSLNYARGPILAFDRHNFRLFEQNGPLLSELAPRLAKRLYGDRSRFLLTSLSPVEQREAQDLIRLILDSRKFDCHQIGEQRRRILGFDFNSRIAQCGTKCGKRRPVTCC
jgi:hypothetical protein